MASGRPTALQAWPCLCGGPAPGCAVPKHQVWQSQATPPEPGEHARLDQPAAPGDRPELFFKLRVAPHQQTPPQVTARVRGMGRIPTVTRQVGPKDLHPKAQERNGGLSKDQGLSKCLLVSSEVNWSPDLQLPRPELAV